MTSREVSTATREPLVSIIIPTLDTVLPEGALGSISTALQDTRVAGGAFSRRYASASITLRVTCQLARFRNLLIGWHLGDQAMFVRRASFFQLGGFREVDRFEDLDFSRRLRKFGRTATLRACVTSSSRRFDHSGPVGRTLRDFLLTVRYCVGGLQNSQPSTSSPAAPVYECAKALRSL